MEKPEYERAIRQKKICEDKIKDIRAAHLKNPDLFHQLGSDRYCRYCEQYNLYTSLLNTCIEEIQEYEKEHNVVDPVIKELRFVKKVRERPVTRRKYSVFDIVFKDGEEYLLYGHSPSSCCRLVHRDPDDISRSTIVTESYYETTYLEKKNGGLSTLDVVLKEHKSKRKSALIIARKAQSKLKEQGTCYNEQPFEFLKYSKNLYSKLEQFCTNCKITRTKKFNKTGRVSIETPRGSLGLDAGNVLIKLGKDIFIALPLEDFQENFVEDENLVWIQRR